MKSMLFAMAMGAAALPAVASAQTAPVMAPMAGTRLDVSATGEVTRVPDVAIISAGVVTRQPTASAAIQENATRMERVLAALKRAGVAERDIQTSSINLNPEYRYQDNQPPQLNGYTASNQVSVRFRDIRNSGRILDALVAEGANQINGPSLTIDKPETALDEARTQAIANGQARAELLCPCPRQARGAPRLCQRGRRKLPPPPMPMMMEARAQSADTKIVPGEQKLQVTLSMVFELQ